MTKKGVALLRILLLGATGLIGSAVAARLGRAGHEVVGLARTLDAAARRVPVANWIRFDLRSLTRSEDWTPHLAGIDAVVNCAGVLQDSARDSTAKVHRDAPRALWAACAGAGVRRVVQVSAIGLDEGGVTAFSGTKFEGDAALAASGLDFAILRPSVVIGGPAYGGTALIRALAALPVLPCFPDTGPIDIVQLDDVVETVLRLLEREGPLQVTLDLAGPERLTLAEIVAAWRRWLGWPPTREVRLPDFLLALGWRAGDLVATLGWRPPIRSTARRELVRGATGDNRTWIEATGIRPTGFSAALAASPASVQERWFARLFLVRPLALGIFALFWLVTGLISLGPGRETAVAQMAATVVGPWAAPAVIGGALADVAIGLAIMVRRTARTGLHAALAVSILYLALGTLLQPELWADPLGPLVKILPILALNLLCLAILDDR